METIRFGIIGGGLMGREFASAAARWCHLTDIDVRPQITAVCSRSDKSFGWFRQHFPSVTQYTHDYRELLANGDVDAVYIAVPHDLHEAMYVATLEAGKHLMGEKPFGIDRDACRAILDAAAKRPDLFVRCASEFPYYPAVQQVGKLIDDGTLGRIIEIETGFLHSSDLNPDKPINWKRMIAHNGAYGVMGDLGMHVCHVPFRAGWRPKSVRAVLTNIVKQRPDGKGGKAPCETWDNATLLCDAEDPATGETFPWTAKTFRIAPGEKNTWYVSILGTRTSVRFSTKNPRRLEMLTYDGGEQVWGQVDMGYDAAFKTITGGIFEFGLTDAIQQMWAAFCHELRHRANPSRFVGCATPEEAALSHDLFTAALESHAQGAAVAVG